MPSRVSALEGVIRAMVDSYQDNVKVWDIVVRSFHWTLVVSFTLCYVTGDELHRLHAYLGYGILGLLAIRVVWGVLGTKHARFSDFVYGWRKTRAYLAGLAAMRPPYYLGHNPIGGWMVVLLLVSLLLACWTGLEAYGDQGYGPLADRPPTLSSTGEKGHVETEDELWEELHEASVNVALFLVIIHIAGVFISSLLHRENLVRAMWTGYKTQTKHDTT